MATASQIETWISEVESQRQKVALGQSYVELWRDGRRVRVNIASMADLNKYLDTLRSELFQAQTEEGLTPTRRRRAIGLAYRN